MTIQRQSTASPSAISIALVCLVIGATPLLTEEPEPKQIAGWLARILDRDRAPETLLEPPSTPSSLPSAAFRPGGAAPTLGDPALSVDDDLALANTSSMFKDSQLFLWDDAIALNLALGRDALASATTGFSNTALGASALFANADGERNTAVGALALNGSIGEDGNTAVGYKALYTSYDGRRNTAVGDSALRDSLYADSNTAIGYHALSANLFGRENTGVGSFALASNTYGQNNTAAGYSALINNLTGDFNTAIGSAALVLSDSHHNTAIGFNALGLNQAGQSNTATGSQALKSNTAGIGNTADGRLSLATNYDGMNNTAVGSVALYSNQRGDNNTSIGLAALFGNRNGDRNIGVGYRAGYNPLGSDDGIFIGNEGSAMDSAVIRIGTQGTQAAAYVAGIHMTALSAGAEHQVCVDAAGQLGECTTMKSSARFKRSISEMGAASEGLHDLRPVTFAYRDAVARGRGRIEYGLIAEEVARIYPDLVRIDSRGQPHAVRYEALITLLLNELQEQSVRLEHLESKLADLEEAAAILPSGAP